jgi:hypothetical protein
MAKVLKFNEHQLSIKAAEELIDMIINPKLNESSIDDTYVQKILKGLSGDLKFNYGLVFTFGAGIKAMYPIVDNLIKNGNLKIDLNSENIVLLSLAALAVTYLEEKNNKSGDNKLECKDCEGLGIIYNKCDVCEGEGCEECEVECETCKGKGYIDSVVTKADARTILEELKLRGIGNGIVKKLVKCFKSIGNLLKILFKNTPYIISGFMDMFAYTSILIPTMNAISALIGNYNIDMDTLVGNFASMGVGVGTFLAKNGFNYLVNKLKDKLNIKINPDLQKPTFARSYDIKDGESDDMGKNKLIKEQ